LRNHDPKDDAYNPNWKATRGKITKVIVDLSMVGVSPEAIEQIKRAIGTGEMFIIHDSNSSLIAYYPSELRCLQRTTDGFEAETYFEDVNQLLNNLKLAMFAHREVIIPSKLIKSC
jgi:hypothetical protein